MKKTKVLLIVFLFLLVTILPTVSAEQMFEYCHAGTQHNYVMAGCVPPSNYPNHNGYCGQTFRVGAVGQNVSFILTRVKVLICLENFYQIDPCYIYIRNTDINGLPTGPDLSTNSFNPGSPGAFVVRDFTLTTPIRVQAGHKYAILLSCSGRIIYMSWGVSFGFGTPNTLYPKGDAVVSTDYGVTWGKKLSGVNWCEGWFETYGELINYSEVPANDSNHVLINSNMGVRPTNLNNLSMNVSFYWGNGTLINTVVGVANNTFTEFSIIDHYFMSHDTEYTWHVVTQDGNGTNDTSQTWSFHTCRAWDLNGDGETNYLDVSSLVSHYGETVSSPGYEPWDIIEDGIVNYLDVSSLVSHYGESY